MDFITPIINPIVEYLIHPIKKPFCFLVSTEKYVKDMEKEMHKLKLTEEDIKEKKKRADTNSHEVSHHVSAWLEDVKTIKDKTQNIIPTCGIRWFNVTKRYKTVKQSYAIIREIKALIERNKSDINWTNEQKSLAKVLSNVASVRDGTQFIFGSREIIFKKALTSLQSSNESHKIIALCGMGGVGKTTMMEQLKKAVKDPKMFDWVVKVVIGENSDPISLQQALAQYIGKDLTETNKDARAERLREKLVDMSEDGKKKILVIMDDIWKEVDLKDVGLNPLPNGFKLLLTSRFEYVCTQMGAKRDSIYKLRVLDKAEAKTLFFGIAGPLSEGDDDQELQKIGENIVNKCGGLPIAIITIAKNLSGNIKEAWQKALWRLEKDDLKDLENITHRIFEMSYENLKEDDDKALFLLSGLFPYDFDIHTEDLLRYGWGLNFFKDAKTLAIARRHLKTSVNNLIRANLLTESDQMGYVKMHDLVRAFVLSNFTKVKQASIVNHDNMSLHMLTEYSNKSYERILIKCTGMSEFPEDFNYLKLSLLILMDGNNILKFQEDIYERMENLQVVSYENLGIPLLPVTFEHLTKLQTLCLQSCTLMNDISFLGSLSNLEILSFANCNITWLPSTIGKLKKLKLLDLTGCVDLSIDDGVFRDLGSLEELYMRAYNGSPIRFTDGNCDELKKLSQQLFALELEFFENKAEPKNMSFKNLKRFRISIGCELEYDEKESFRNTIDLAVDCNELFECEISDLFEETEELHLRMNDMNHLEDVAMHHSFSSLRVLYVYKCADLTCLFTLPVASGLKKLERLIVSECPKLKALVGENNRVGEIKFQKLIFMSLEGLPNIESLCDNGIQLPEMVELVLDSLPNFTSIYPDNNTSLMQSLLNKQVVIPKLEKLDISRMENMKQIWPSQISSTEKNSVSLMRHIVVRECDNLVNLFPSNPLPLLNHLEELEVYKCGSLQVLFNIDFESVNRMEGYISRLRSIRVNDLGKLKEVWRVEGLNNSEIIINGFECVERIEIERCYNFMNVFTPTTTNFNLKSLTTYISYSTGKDSEGWDDSTNESTESDQEIEIIPDMDAYNLNVTYPFYLLHTCHHLQHLQLGDDKRVEVVFDMDSPSNRVVPLTIRDTQPSLLLPYLNVLELYHLKEMSHVWKCNWNKFIISQHQFPFQNLTDISLWNCHKIKYLFSPLMAKYISNLKWVNIDECDGMEEIISHRDDENPENIASTSSHDYIALFPHLDILVLSNLSCLKRIDSGDQRRRRNLTSSSSNISNTIHYKVQSTQVIGACWSLSQYSRQIYIQNCDTLSSLIPWYAATQTKKLENLKLKFCKSMMEVFESDSVDNNTNNVDEGTATLTSPSIKNIAINVVPQLSNLRSMCITECDRLLHVFTFSTLESLKQLKELKIERCYAIQVIVKEENEASSKLVVFPRVETLELDDLPNLKGFFLGTNTFRWSSLDNVMINDCPQLVMFTKGKSNTPKLKYIRTTLGKHNLECGLNFQNAFSSLGSVLSKGMPCSYYNLVELFMGDKDVATVIPSNVLRQLQKLEEINLKSCNSIEEVFEVGPKGTNNSGSNISQSVVKVPNLRQVNLEWLDSLKYIWKRNPWMVLEFPNLTSVSIQRCYTLEYVFTSSMVGSLLKLQDIHISMCDNVEVIVKEEEEDFDAKVNEIMLPLLKSIKLEYLSSLKGFGLGNEAFSWPSLDTLQINNCPSILTFTNGHLATPKLKVIDTSFGMCSVHGDLNSFITTKQEEGNEF